MTNLKGTSKSSVQAMACPSATTDSNGLNRGVVDNVMRTIRKDYDILERSLAEKKYINHEPKSSLTAVDEASGLLQQVEDNSAFIGLITTIVNKIIMSSNTFKEIICDAV